jgi:hypothetical protein
MHRIARLKPHRMLTCFICDDTAAHEAMEEAVPVEEVPLDDKEVVEMEFLSMHHWPST